MDSLNGTSTTNYTNKTHHDEVLEAPLLNLTPMGFRHGLTVYIALAMLLGLPGHVIVLLVHRGITTQTATDWLVFYLAVCDICSLAVCGPSFILMITHLWNYVMPSSLCSFNFMIMYSCFSGSASLITATAVVRRSVMITNREPMLARKSKLFGALLIFVSIGLGSPSIVLNKNTPSGFYYFDKTKTHIQTIIYGVYLLITLIFIAVTCGCYLNIILKLRIPARVAPIDLHINSAYVKTRRAAIKATICVALVFVVFFFSTAAPLIVITILNVSTHNVGVAINTFIFVIYRLYFTNNFANPLIYFSINSRFRYIVRSMFQRSTTSTTHSFAFHLGLTTILGQTIVTNISTVITDELRLHKHVT